MCMIKGSFRPIKCVTLSKKCALPGYFKVQMPSQVGYFMIDVIIFFYYDSIKKLLFYEILGKKLQTNLFRLESRN